MSGSLQDKVAIVTGAGQGMGRAFAQELAEEGAHVTIAELDAASGERAADEIVADGFSATSIRTDVADGDSVRSMVDAVVATHGRVDILINNAGIPAGGPSEDITDEEWEHFYGIVLRGVFRCSQAVANASMIQNRSGVILNIGSMAGLGGWAQRALYTPAKAGVISLTNVLGVEWARYGIRVVGINPGQIETPLNDYVFERGLADRETFTNRAPTRRFAEPEEIAKAVRFLVSDEASYITAEVITIDGGWMAWGGIEEPIGV